MRGAYTRRELLGITARVAGIGAVVGPGWLTRLVSARYQPVLSARDRKVLNAALARMIPSDSPDDWSAADVGAGDYIERLLSGDGRIYAGGPYRGNFKRFQRLARIKEMGWSRESRRLRKLYRAGLAELDRRAGGDFAAAPSETQDAILTSLDLEGSAFFAALYDHTMEGVYAHPVYGGNKDYRAWRDLCYQGDVHGVRFPKKGSRGAWNTFGGYAPEEMAEPGACP